MCSHGGAEENHENHQLGKSVSRPGFETNTFRVEVGSQLSLLCHEIRKGKNR
jgi:hypothetical protein